MAAGSMIEIIVNPLARECSCIQLNDLRASSELKKSDKLFSDIAGGFTYLGKSKITQNRHILWRVLNNKLYLEEICWNYDILSNRLEIKIPNEVILPNVIFHEAYDKIIIYFSTTNCLHAIHFVHPEIKSKHGPSGVNATLYSIFHGVSEKYIHTRVPLEISCKFFDAVTLPNGDIFYGMVTDTGTLLVVNNDSLCFELKEASIVQRLWNGLVPSFVRGESSSYSAVESLVMHDFDGSNLFAFTLCRDLKVRVWSIATKACVHTTDLVSLNLDNFDSQPGSVDSLCLRKAKNTDSGQLILVAHFSFIYSSQFIILEVFLEQKEIVVVHVSHFLSNFNNLQDICITQDHIWSLWNSSDGESVLSYAPIEGGKDFERGWHTVHLAHADKDEIFIPVFQDVKEVFMRKLFSPQLYEKDTLIKALQIFVKTNELSTQFIPNESSSLLEIKESVLRIIDMQVENTVLNTGAQDSGYQLLQRECWFNFYSFVQQYSQGRLKPVGLHVSEIGCLVVHQDSYGYVQPLTWSDHLYLSNLETCEGVQSFIDYELELKGSIISRDILFLIESMKAISLQFHEDVLFGIDSDLQGNEDVKAFLENMADVLITNSSKFEQLVGDDSERVGFLLSLEARLKHLKNPVQAVNIILSALDISENHNLVKEIQSPGSRNNNYDQIFCGHEGIEIISQGLSKLSFTRMHFCRDLFILLKLMNKISSKINLDLSCSKDFGSVVSNKVYELLRSYHAIHWSADAAFQPIDSSTVDANLVHLAALNLTERSPASKSARKTTSFTDQPMSLLSSYMRDVGVMKAIYSLNSVDSASKYQTSETLSFFFILAMKNIWMINEKCSDFPEYLAAHCQYSMLGEYLHFADTWCVTGRGTKDFLLGQSYLGLDEPAKALKYFVSAVKGITLKEPLLLNLSEDDGEQELLVQYFVKVMRLFEQWNYPLMVISAASSAIAMASDKSKNKPVLWSVVFKYHLLLGHYSEAYAAIIHNPDKTRRHDCLRHFIVTLCEQGMFKEICAYPYVNLEDEVVSIIEARARTTDITVNKYYDILYSYHILKSDYRKAATTMYEQSCRLATEMHGLKSLQKQAKCLLASLNALKLVDSKYAWIVRPQENYNSSKTVVKTCNDYSHSPKRREDGEEIYYSSTAVKKHATTIVIIEFHDVEKSYMLLLARLKLLQHGKNESIVVGPGLSASETVILLSQTGLFDMSFSLANAFNLPLKRIFETLASKCANLVNYTKSDIEERWNWLLLNEISTSQLVNASSASHHAFLLLQTYLERFDQKSSTNLKTVTSKLLSLGSHLPSWLVKDYEFANPAELLHLYLCYDMISEAVQLAIKYINAVLGEGKAHLGLNTALHATTPAVWLPYSSFDQLLAALKDNYENQEAFYLYEELQAKLGDYFTKLERTSCDKIEHTYRVSTRVN